MSLADFDKLNDAEQRAREGVFDDQLSIPAPFIGAPQPLTTIIKRDGRETPFDKSKIADAIFKAAQSIGSEDPMLAQSLASGVAIYLSKKLQGKPPTVEQVQDAVERVLIELGHTETALAYVRYRDRRARIRKLRSGDPRALLSELDEARPAGGAAALSLFVRTGAETLAEWDREKIVQALVRETGIDAALAGAIAREVEQQIAAAKVKTLTAALVRELVDAKLIEYGLEEHHRRHQRLGVPLYDAQEIICTPGINVRRGVADPAATDRVLAERVKKEFALTQVFSRDVADAHLRGDIHLLGLGFIDRLHSAAPSAEFVKRFGVALPGPAHRSRPPKYANALLAQLVSFNALLENHFSEALDWTAANVLFAPFLQDLDERALRQAAQVLITGLSYRSLAHGNPAVARSISICWDVPAELKDVEAIGPCGAPTGRTYGEYLHTVQRAAWILMDVYREGDTGGTGMPAPTPLVRISSAFFKSPGSGGFLDRAAAVAAQGRKVHFVLERAHPPLPAGPPWRLRRVTAHEAAINLPRVAFCAGAAAALLGELDRAFEFAVRAHTQKRDFAVRLLSLKDSGPLALLAMERDGAPYLDLQEASYRVGLTGLNECVQHLTGLELHESEEAMALGLRIVTHLRQRCVEWSRREDLRLVLAQTADLSVCRRFATLDVHQHPEAARAVVKTDAASQELRYTPSTLLNPEVDINPIERLRQEGRFHEWLEEGAQCFVAIPDPETSRESIADFVEKSYYQTHAAAVVFGAE